MHDDFDEVFSEVKRVLCVFAHPDDLEIYCGGTIARLIASGVEVRSVKMTNGDKGSRENIITSAELSATRQQEDNEAMSLLGIKPENSIYLDLGDGAIENTLENIGKVVTQIREFKPDLIITHNPEDKIIRSDKDASWVNHRDHLNTGLTVLDAAYPYSRDTLFYPELNMSGHNVTRFLLVDYFVHPDMVSIDMTDFVEVRNRATATHTSQYPMQKAVDTTDFYTIFEGTERRYERFRYLVAD